MKRDNNFNFLRIFGACLVISGHMGAIMGGTPTLLFTQAEHILGVSVFFLLGGYLIAKSWKRDPHPGRYALKRILRVIPEYYVCLIVTVIACSFLTTADSQTYWAGARVYVLHNMRFYTWIALPGVFEHNPLPNAVNGAIWTLPIEMLMYVITPLYLGLTHRIRNPKVRKSIIFLITCATIFPNFFSSFHRKSFVFYGTEWVSAAADISFWFIGIMMEEFELEKHASVTVGVSLLMILNLVGPQVFIQNVILYIVWPYFIMSLGLNDSLKKIGSHLEISYGMYLYGFVIQQTVIYFMETGNHMLSVNRCIVVCTLLSMIAGALSSILIARPVRHLQAVIMKKV